MLSKTIHMTMVGDHQRSLGGVNIRRQLDRWTAHLDNPDRDLVHPRQSQELSNDKQATKSVRVGPYSHVGKSWIVRSNLKTARGCLSFTSG